MYVYTTFCLFIHTLMGIWVASISWLLWIILLWYIVVAEYSFCLNLCFKFFGGIYLEVELMNHMVILCLIFWKSYHTLFHSSCTILHYHQQCVRVPISPYPHQYLFSLFKIIAILIGVKWHLIMFLIYISLMTNDIEHLFMCLSAICMSSLEKCLFNFFAHLQIELLVL